MPEVSVYVPKENGDLKFVTDADIEGDTTGDLLIDAFLDENPRNQDDVFVIIDQDGGTLEVVEVEDREPVQPRRKIVIRSGGGSRNGEVEDDSEEERPSKRKPGPKPGSKRGKAKPKPKAKGSQAKAGRPRQSKPKARAKSGGKPKGGAFGRKAEDD